MNTLSIDTSARTSSVALLNDDNILAEFFMNSGRNHAETLLPAIDNLLVSVGLKADQMDLFAFTAGPGSFTGLRVGMSTIKGLAFILQKPVIGVCTLDALARNVPDLPLPDVVVCPLMDAGRGQVFTALYANPEQGIFEKTLIECVVRPDEFLSSMAGRVLFLGDGAEKYRNVIEELLPGRSFFLPPHLNYVSAGAVGRVAWKKCHAGEVSDIMTLSPDYLRASYATKG